MIIIVILKPQKGLGEEVMDKSEHLWILSEAAVNDTSKFQAVILSRPNIRERPLKYYYPKKDLDPKVCRILPKTIANSILPTGSRLTYNYV